MATPLSAPFARLPNSRNCPSLPSYSGLPMNRRHLAEPEGRLEWPPPASRPNGAGKASAPTQIPKANILLVDDRADKLLAIEAIISSLGQNVVKARSGKEALRHLLHMDFAVIL